MTTYNIPPSQVSCEPIEKHLHNCQKPIDGCRINEPQREVEPVPKPPTVPFPNPSTPTLSPLTHLPMQNISCVLTHIIDDNNNIQYVYTRKTVTDNIIFLIAQPDVKELHKSNRRHFTQYNATLQRRFLYDDAMLLASVLDKTTKIVDQPQQQHGLADNMTLFLTRRSNGTDTIIAWEHAGLAKSSVETKMKCSYKPISSKRTTEQRNYTPDDKGWGNIMESKEDGTVRIIMENINNISS